MNTPAKTKEKQFRKGVSGNPKGRPQGSRNKATLAIELLLNGEAEAITRKAIEMALEGDGPAMRLCLDRIFPPRKDRPVTFDMPDIESLSDAVSAMGCLLSEVASGNISPGEAQAVAGVVETYRRTLETEEIERRLENLEAHRARR